MSHPTPPSPAETIILAFLFALCVALSYTITRSLLDSGW